MHPYLPYDNYITGYNTCLEAAGYSVYSAPGASGGETAAPMPGKPYMPAMPGQMPGGVMPGYAGMCPGGSAPYTVQPGDSFYTIAYQFGLSVNELIAANPGIPANMLQAGSILCVPQQSARPCPCPAGAMAYTVAAGDTLTSIADRFSLSVYSLAIANPGVSVDNLMPGTRLCIAPFACLPTCVESERYTIAEGEDLMSLAQKFQVSTDDLLKTNPFSPPCYFSPGNAICLPAGASTAPPANQP